ncbi:hypothetical protein HNY73_009652 [Argiope bruennichi]|uniref:Uncharacterized protein n=1 Tax=Argiope bruennichi TaxID=94029 RepID=A0A8T0FA42_ARGBR|nr:hypothetical protein HNY73_009652 [Argiope bruennichi]
MCRPVFEIDVVPIEFLEEPIELLCGMYHDVVERGNAHYSMECGCVYYLDCLLDVLTEWKIDRHVKYPWKFANVAACDVDGGRILENGNEIVQEMGQILGVILQDFVEITGLGTTNAIH